MTSKASVPEVVWTQMCNARVSDRIGDIPLMRVNAATSDPAGRYH
jgi:hypothetical protein